MARWGAEEWQTYRWVYYRLTERVDALLGRVLTALEESGHADNTIVLFTSDHGEMGGSHKLKTKLFMYEEATAVPLIVCAPGVTRAGSIDRTHLVSGLDIAPTLCDLAGIPLPASFAGRSLKPLLDSSATAWRDHVVVEMGDTVFCRMVRSERYKYVVYAKGQRPEQLFDLETDPHELKNLAYDTAAKPIIETHRELLVQWVRDTKDGFVFPSAAQKRL